MGYSVLKVIYYDYQLVLFAWERSGKSLRGDCMSMFYNVVVNGQSAGPYDVATLTRMAQSGMINANTLVWRQGMNEWQPIGSLPELNMVIAGSVQVAPPPIPVAAAPSPVPVNAVPVANTGGAQAKNNSASVAGLIVALLGAICLLVIHLLPFEVDTESERWVTIKSINHDLDMYPLWFGGLIIGCALTVLGLCLVIRSISKDHSDNIAIVGLVFCVIAAGLAIYGCTKLSKKTKSYSDLKLAKDEYSGSYSSYDSYNSKKMKEHNDAINDVTAEIDRILS